MDRLIGYLLSDFVVFGFTIQYWLVLIAGIFTIWMILLYAIDERV